MNMHVNIYEDTKITAGLNTILPHKACLRREGLQLNRRSSEINPGLLFATVSDAHEIPLANQISCCLG